MAREFSCAFIETSAKSRINVENAFSNIVREIRRYNKEMSSFPAGPGRDPILPGSTSKGEPKGGCLGGKCIVM